MSSNVAVVSDSQLNQLARSYWQIWAGMHWGFRKHACVLWCCAGQISADRAYSVLGIDTFTPIDLVIFYRELVCELVPEQEMASLIVKAMPLPERKHMKRFYAGLQVFEAARDKQSIARLMNEVFVVNFLPRLRESDDSEQNRISDGRRFAEGLRRTRVMRSDDPPMTASKTPLILIAESCVDLIKTLPSLEYDEKNKEDTKVVGNEQDSIWEAAKTCFRECPSVVGGIPRHIKRQMAIEKGLTPQQRYLNAIEYDRKYSQPARIIKRR
jgi:hypothetical protein